MGHWQTGKVSRGSLDEKCGKHFIPAIIKEWSFLLLKEKVWQLSLDIWRAEFFEIETALFCFSLGKKWNMYLDQSYTIIEWFGSWSTDLPIIGCPSIKDIIECRRIFLYCIESLISWSTSLHLILNLRFHEYLSTWFHSGYFYPAYGESALSVKLT